MGISIRISNQELPAVKELHETCALEFRSQPHPDKKLVHYPDFSSVKRWLGSLGIETNLYDLSNRIRKPYNPKAIDFEEADIVLTEGIRLRDLVVQKTLKTKDTSALQQVTEYLNMSDTFDKADVAIVFGGNKTNPTRPNLAADLYKAGKVSKLIFSGKGPVWQKEESAISEAEAYAEFAKQAGVPESAIVLEEDSISVADNVRRSVDLIQRTGIKHKKIVAVTSWFCMRRTIGMIWKYVPNSIEIYAVSAISSSGNFTLEGWFKNEAGIDVVWNEFVKMRIGVALNTY